LNAGATELALTLIFTLALALALALTLALLLPLLMVAPAALVMGLAPAVRGSGTNAGDPLAPM
jgi:hypothetical protein